MADFIIEEIELIKQHLQDKLDETVIISLISSIILCPIITYARQDDFSLVEKYGYDDGTLILVIGITSMIVVIWVWKKFRINGQFRKYRKYLRKKKVHVKIDTIKRSYLPPFQKYIVSENQEDFKKLNLSKEQLKSISKGDLILLEYEEQTKTLFNFKTLEQNSH